MYKITVIPGDGIGIEVMEATLHILEVSDIEFDYQEANAGYACFQETGTTLPDETVELAMESDATLFGAVTSVPDQKTPGSILSLRKKLGVYANLRPIKSYPGITILI